MKVLTLSALCNTRIVLFRLPRVLTATERSSQRSALANLADCSSLAHLGEGLAGGIDSGRTSLPAESTYYCHVSPSRLFTSVFSAGKSLLWWAMTAFISPWPWWLCVIWYAAVWLGRMSRATGLHWPGPITTPLFFHSLLFSPSPPPSLFPSVCAPYECIH